MKGRTIAAVLAVGLLASCASGGPWRESKGKYVDYHDYLRVTSEGVLMDRMPAEPAAALSNCVADLGAAQMTPAQIEILDAAARGEKSAPAELAKEASDRFSAVMGQSVTEMRENMRPHCPGVIADYGSYLNNQPQ